VRAELADGDDPAEEIRQKLPVAYYSWGALTQAQYLEAKYLLPGYVLSLHGGPDGNGTFGGGQISVPGSPSSKVLRKLPAHMKMKVLDKKYLLKQAAKG